HISSPIRPTAAPTARRSMPPCRSWSSSSVCSIEPSPAPAISSATASRSPTSTCCRSSSTWPKCRRARRCCSARPSSKPITGAMGRGGAPRRPPHRRSPVVKPEPEQRVMRYMFLIYARETETAERSPEVWEQVRAAHWAVIDDARQRGVFLGAEPLQSTATATTIRIEDDRPSILDGPFAETKEQLGGYYLLDCRDLDEAIDWAARIQTACKRGQGCVEIRPIAALPPR